MRRKKRERKIVDSCSAGDSGDTGLTLGSGRSPGKGNGDPRHYSYLENPHGQRSRVGSPWGCKESGMTEAAERAHMCTHTHTRLLVDVTGGRDSCAHTGARLPLGAASSAGILGVQWDPPPRGRAGRTDYSCVSPALGAVPGTRQLLGSHGSKHRHPPSVGSLPTLSYLAAPSPPTRSRHPWGGRVLSSCWPLGPQKLCP